MTTLTVSLGLVFEDVAQLHLATKPEYELNISPPNLIWEGRRHSVNTRRCEFRCLFSTALLNKNGLPPRSSPLSPPSLTAAALVSSASAPPPRCSLRSLRHRPAAVHRIGDGAELEGPGPYWRSPRPGILPGPERGGGGALERGQREGCPRETLQGEHG